jgi:hypothetical protein
MWLENTAYGAGAGACGDVVCAGASRQLRRALEDKMDEKFIVVWSIDGKTTRIPLASGRTLH